MFLDFVDNNSAPNGHKEGIHGKTYYFNPKFSMIRSPNKSDPQFAFKCRHSVLHEFNSSLKVWEESQLVHSIHGYNSIVLTLEYVLIVQYCDTCKDYNEEISRARQTINRLRQSGHSSEVSIHTQEDLISKYTTLLQYHKNEAQNGLEYYNKLANETKFCYQRILKMQQQSTCYHLQTMQEDFTAFISADYMMSKNLPYWGDSAQPGKSYYMMKLVCDVFGIVDHSTDSNYTYICDELAAGSKSSDHTLTFLNHFVETHIEKWVTQLCLCLDNARICKNQYILAGLWKCLLKSGLHLSVSFT